MDTDLPSRIHWKRSATVGRHMVKLFAADRTLGFVLRLAAGANDADFEQGLREAAGYVEAAVARDRGLVLQVGGEQFEVGDAGGRLQALRLLAELERRRLPHGPAVQIEVR